MAVTTADNGLHDAMPWVEKYRPESLEDVAAHAEIINTSTALVMMRNSERKIIVMNCYIYRSHDCQFYHVYFISVCR